MNLKPEELIPNGYILLEELGHMELVPFVRLYMTKPTKSARIYLASNLIVLCVLLTYLWINYGSPGFQFGDALTHFSYGLALAFCLVPIHEYIHVLAYKSQGAMNTSYDANWKKFYFMAVADQFVANKKEFQMVALAPFVVITITLTILFLFTSVLWSFTILGILLTHTAFCSGDFGLLSYFDFHQDKNLVTYDDRKKKTSYFYFKDATT